MRESEVRGVRRGGTPVAARPARGTGGGPDLVERGFEAESPNRPHVADVAYVRMANDLFDHMAFAADVFARRIVGRACATAIDTGELPLRALEQAVSWGRPAWRRGRSRAPFRPGARGASLVYATGVEEFGMPPPTGTVGDSYGNAMAGSADGAYRTELVWRRKPFRDLRDLELATFRRVSWRGLEASAPALGPQDTGTDRNRVSCKPSGASRPTIRAEQKSGHIAKAQQWIAEGSHDDFILHSALDWNLVLDLAGGALSNCSNIQSTSPITARHSIGNSTHLTIHKEQLLYRFPHSVLGKPTGPEQPTVHGAYQNFQNGTAYWNRSRNATYTLRKGASVPSTTRRAEPKVGSDTQRPRNASSRTAQANPSKTARSTGMQATTTPTPPTGQSSPTGHRRTGRTAGSDTQRPANKPTPKAHPSNSKAERFFIAKTAAPFPAFRQSGKNLDEPTENLAPHRLRHSGNFPRRQKHRLHH